MFLTCAPGGLLTVGPTSNMAIVAPGASSLRIRAYADAVGPLPTMATSTAAGYRLAAHRPATSSWMRRTDFAESMVG